VFIFAGVESRRAASNDLTGNTERECAELIGNSHFVVNGHFSPAYNLATDVLIFLADSQRTR
jgi:hypothetical protein